MRFLTRIFLLGVICFSSAMFAKEEEDLPPVASSQWFVQGSGGFLPLAFLRPLGFVTLEAMTLRLGKRFQILGEEKINLSLLPALGGSYIRYRKKESNGEKQPLDHSNLIFIDAYLSLKHHYIFFEIGGGVAAEPNGAMFSNKLNPIGGARFLIGNQTIQVGLMFASPDFGGLTARLCF